MFAALLGYWLNTILTHAQVGEWGWRIPFLIGCLIIPLIFLFRRTLETEDFKAQKLIHLQRNFQHTYKQLAHCTCRHDDECDDYDNFLLYYGLHHRVCKTYFRNVGHR